MVVKIILKTMRKGACSVGPKVLDARSVLICFHLRPNNRLLMVIKEVLDVVCVSCGSIMIANIPSWLINTTDRGFVNEIMCIEFSLIGINLSCDLEEFISNERSSMMVSNLLFLASSGSCWFFGCCCHCSGI